RGWVGGERPAHVARGARGGGRDRELAGASHLLADPAGRRHPRRRDGEDLQPGDRADLRRATQPGRDGARGTPRGLRGGTGRETRPGAATGPLHLSDALGVRLGILVSGRGSNLEAVLDARDRGRLRDVDAALVIANRPRARALQVAARHGVPHRVLERRRFPDAGARDAAIGRAFGDAGCDLVLLAGYDQILRPSYFAAYRGPTV